MDETIVVEGNGDLVEAVADIRWRLGVDIDPAPLTDLARRDSAIAELVARFPGHRPPLVSDPFESIVTSVTAQQVNLTWALTTRRRLTETFGTSHELAGTAVYSFPTAEALAEVDPGIIRDMQFTTRKAEYIVGIAQAAAGGWLEGLHDRSNGGVIEHLTALRGVGRWTAEWLLARCLGRPDVIAAGDLGVRKAVSFSYRRSDHILSEDVVRDIAEPWGNATNLVVHLLLETLV